MDLSFFEALGWRDLVIAAVAAFVLYILINIARLLTLRNRQPMPAPPPPAEPVIAAKAAALEAAPAVAIATPARAAAREPWPNTEADFAERLREATVGSEIKHLRGDLARMRDELTSLGDELVALRKELEALQASRHVSPLYGEAIGLAQQGLDARSIAERCAISISEAELVAALSQQRNLEEKKGDDDDRK